MRYIQISESKKSSLSLEPKYYMAFKKIMRYKVDHFTGMSMYGFDFYMN